MASFVCQFSYESFRLIDNIPEHLPVIEAIKIYSSDFAFAAIIKTGKIITWGNYEDEISDQPEGEKVTYISAISDKFAGLTESGKIIPEKKELENKPVLHIYSTDEAFAALTESGEIITY